MRQRGVDVVAKMTPKDEIDIPREGYLRIEPKGEIVAIPLPVDEPGRYNITLQACLTFDGAAESYKLGTDKDTLKTFQKSSNPYKAPFHTVGEAEARDGQLMIYLQAEGPVGIDAMRWEKVKP